MAKLHTREILNYELSCRPVLSERVLEAAELQPGDHIHWCHIGSWRDGIIVQVQTPNDGSLADLILIRYGSSNGIVMRVTQQPWKIELSKDKLYKYKYADHCHPPGVVILRAKSCLGYGGYNALRNNNSDFCRWCMSGKHTYLCINETFLCPFVDESLKEDDGTFFVMVTTLDDLNQGDHISWMTRPGDGNGGHAQAWRHGIITDVDQKMAEMVAIVDKSITLETVKFTALNFTDHLVHLHVYERCHMPDAVIDRAQSKVGGIMLPDDCYSFVRWCKLGIPPDSESIDKTILSPTAPCNQLSGENQGLNLPKEATNATTRSVTMAAVRSVEGVTLKTAARQAPRVLVRGTAEGAAAVAAVGVEAAMLAVDVTLTYRSFKRKQITKDKLLEQNIQASVRSISAASGSIGAGTAGAAIGTLAFPGIGTVIGGIIGGIVGGIAGQVGGHFAGRAIASAAQRPYENIFVESEVVERL